MNLSADYCNTAKAEEQETGDIDLEGKNDKTENVEGKNDKTENVENDKTEKAEGKNDKTENVEGKNDKTKNVEGESIPLHVQEAILIRCAAKTLLRFKSVSKSYYGLIRSEWFIMEHMKHSVETSTNLNLILTHTVCPVSDSDESWYGQLFIGSLDTTNTLNLEIPLRKIDQPFTDWEEGEDTPFIGSCNGLIALKDYSGSIVVHNPSTRENYLIIYCGLGELDDEDHVCDGFGYSPVDDDYKLVRIIQRRGNIERTEIQIYSFKDENLGTYAAEGTFHLGSSCADASFANGRLYWLVASRSQLYVQDLILIFDLSTAQISTAKIPIDTLEVYFVFLFPFAGSICFSCVDHGDGRFCPIWKLKHISNGTLSWKRFSFRKAVFGDGCDFVKPLAYSKCKGKILVDTYNGEKEAWNLYWYDRRDKIAHGPISINNVPEGPRDSAICTETLVSFEDTDDEEAESSSEEEEKGVFLSLDEYEKRQRRREVEEKDLTKGFSS